MSSRATRANALRVHVAGPVLDLHLDSLLWHRLIGYDLRRRHRNRLPGSPLGFHADLPRMLEGGLSGAVFGVHAWPHTGERAYKEILRQIDAFHFYAKHDARLRFGFSVEEFARGHAQGVVVGSLGVEGAHGINGRLERVRELYDRGVRVMTLAHFSRNRAASPSLGLGRNERDGLTSWGRELIRELEDVGIVVDCAHVNEPGRLETLRLAKRPTIISHTGVKGVFDHPRNVSDESLRALAANGGLVGIMFAPIFLGGRLVGSLDGVVRTMHYVAELVGPQHVAIGSDLDGFIPSTPRGLPDISALPALTEALLASGLSEETVRGFLGKNVLDFLGRYADSASRLHRVARNKPDSRRVT